MRHLPFLLYALLAAEPVPAETASLHAPDAPDAPHAPDASGHALTESAAPLIGHRFQQIHMAMPVHLVVYAETTAQAQTAGKAAFARVKALDRVLSDWNPDSELNQACARAALNPVPVSDDLFRVLHKALTLARHTNGAFDPTAGPVVRLWRNARNTGRLPTEHALASARAQIGYQHVRLDPVAKTLFFTRPGLQLDLGGMAKGYIADEVKKTLAHHGIHCFLFTAGGDLLAGTAPPPPPEGALPPRDALPPGASRQMPPEGALPPGDTLPPGEQRLAARSVPPPGWRVDPSKHADASGSDRPVPVLYLHNEAAAISGDTVQFVVIDGVRYSHVVDPRTGSALTDRRMCVVRARHAVDTDGLATAGTIVDEATFKRLLEIYNAEGWVFQANDQADK